MHDDLDSFYSSLLLHLNVRMDAYQFHCITPWRALPTKTRLKLIDAFDKAVEWMVLIGFNKTPGLFRLMAKVINDSSRMNQATVTKIIDCLINIADVLDESFPGYRHSKMFIEILKSKI